MTQCVQYQNYTHWRARAGNICSVQDLAAIGSEFLYAVIEDLSGSSVQVMQWIGDQIYVWSSTVNPVVSPQSIAASGTYLYIADGTDGVRVFDATNRLSPAAGVIVAVGIDCYTVRQHGSFLYVLGVANDGVRMFVYDIENPATPIERGSVLVPGGAATLSVSEGQVLAVSTSLAIIDTTDPLAPTIVGTIDQSVIGPDYRIRAAVSHGGLLFLAEGFLANARLEIFDISDPSTPQGRGSLRGGLTSLGPPICWTDVSLVGDKLYWGTSVVSVVDVSDPNSPFVEESIRLSGDVNGMWSAGDRLYAFDCECYLNAIHVAASPSPAVQLGFIPGGFNDLFVAGDRLYTARRNQGLEVFDISDPANPTVLGKTSDAATLGGVAVDGSYAFATRLDFDTRGPLRVIDVSDPAAPTYTTYTTQPLEFFAGRLDVRDGHLFQLNQGNIVIWSLATPGQPAGVNQWSPALEFAFRENLAFVAAGFDGLQVVDMADPANPVALGPPVVPLGAHVTDVAIEGDYVYAVSSTGAGSLITYDVSDPAAPMVASSGDAGLAGTTDIDVLNGVVYVTFDGEYRGNTPGLFMMNDGPDNRPFASWRPAALERVTIMSEKVGAVSGSGLYLLKPQCAR